jgi:hypothetical protein
MLDIYLVFHGIFDVLFIIEIHWRLFGAVDDVRNAFASHHYFVVITMIVYDEHPFAFLVVSGDEALRFAEIIRRKLRDRSTIEFSHFEDEKRYRD